MMPQMPGMMMPPMPPMGQAPAVAQQPGFQNLMQTESKTQSKFVGAPLLNLFLAYLFFKWHYPFYPVQQKAAQAMPQAPVSESALADTFKGEGAEQMDQPPASETQGEASKAAQAQLLAQLQHVGRMW